MGLSRKFFVFLGFGHFIFLSCKILVFVVWVCPENKKCKISAVCSIAQFHDFIFYFFEAVFLHDKVEFGRIWTSLNEFGWILVESGRVINDFFTSLDEFWLYLDEFERM